MSFSKTISLTILFGLIIHGSLLAAPKSSCITCHSTLPGKLGKPAKLFDSDVHHRAGLDCSGCHGGDPSDNSMNAMSPAKGFRGAPTKIEIPQFCGRCHSDPSYMRRFNPSLRTDQYSQYVTSVHGKRLLKMHDTKVAACVDCHSVHNILPVSDPASPVYPTNVAATCAHCHANAAYMKGYSIPTNQYALYQKSVHAHVLASGDTSAPTCTTCHGSHGATPPGVASVVNVCGTCHALNQQLFDKSPHGSAFAKMGLPGCIQCHSNHAVLKTSDAWVGVGPHSVCLNCHTTGDGGYVMAKKIASELSTLKANYQRAENVVNAAERSGMEVSPAKIELTDAHGKLIQARVAVHSFNAAEVEKFTSQGDANSKKAYQEGIAALHERDFRRKGLAISLIAIVIAIVGLHFKIRQLESRKSEKA